MATKQSKPASSGSSPATPGDESGRRRQATSSRSAESEPLDGFEAVRHRYPPILNTAQVAELLDLNSRTVLNMAGDGRLPASRLPGSRKFHFLLEDIISTLKANRITHD